jgi:hypothetical protein
MTRYLDGQVFLKAQPTKSGKIQRCVFTYLQMRAFLLFLCELVKDNLFGDEILVFDPLGSVF